MEHKGCKNNINCIKTEKSIKGKKTCKCGNKVHYACLAVHVEECPHFLSSRSQID